MGFTEEPTLADVQMEFPDWKCQPGTCGGFYAGHAEIGHVHGESPLELRDEIKLAEARQRKLADFGVPLPGSQPG